MRLYNSYSIEQYKTLKKYCFNLDEKINSIVHFIENFNPNYNILNLPNQYGKYYYTEQQLTSLGILYYVDDSDNDDSATEDDYIYVNVNKMRPHEVLDNTYGKDIYINDEPRDIVVPQGFAIRLDGYNSNQKPVYSIIPLANSGSYYTIKDFIIKQINSESTTCEIQWELTDNATDIYGLSYLLSLVIPGARFYIHDDHDPNRDGLGEYTESPMIFPNFISTPNTPNIATSLNGLWTTDYLISHETLLRYGDNGSPCFEEVTADELVKIDETRVGEYPQSRYIINTNMVNVFQPSNYLDPTLKINIY